jgi:hypothetical protein
MTKKTHRPGTFLLSMIAKAKSDLPRDLSELSDAELIRDMARGMTDFLREAAPNSTDEDDFPALAYMLALSFTRLGYHPSGAETAELAVAENLLAEIDLQLDPEQLRAIAQSDAFADFRKIFRRFEHGITDQPAVDIAVWFAELRECARSAVGVLDNQPLTGH